MRKSSHGQVREPALEYILSLIRIQVANKYIKEGTKVADLGCGYNGIFLRRIAKRIKLGDGYDVSVKNKNLTKNIILNNTDLNKNNFGKSKYYDHVTALAVLEHVENPNRFLKLAKKILKPGGTLIITTPHKRSKKILELFSRIGILSKEEIGDHKNYFDEHRMKTDLKNLDFKIIKLGTFEFGLNICCVAKKV